MTTGRRKIAGWVELEFDDEIELDGIRWLRVKDGLGAADRLRRKPPYDYPREDWIADMQWVNLHATRDLSGANQEWGRSRRFASREIAMRAEVREALDQIEGKIKKKEAELALMRSDYATLLKSSNEHH